MNCVCFLPRHSSYSNCLCHAPKIAAVNEPLKTAEKITLIQRHAFISDDCNIDKCSTRRDKKES